MKKLNREELAEQIPELIGYIKRGHKVELDEIVKELFVNNKPVKGLTHTRGYFVIITLKPQPLYIQYDVEHQIRIEANDFSAVALSVSSVIIYDNYIEYEADRVKTLSAGKDQKGLNLN